LLINYCCKSEPTGLTDFRCKRVQQVVSARTRHATTRENCDPKTLHLQQVESAMHPDNTTKIVNPDVSRNPYSKYLKEDHLSSEFTRVQ
jgi:hypothetical protein